MPEPDSQSFVDRLFNPEGRMRRQDYWLTCIGLSFCKTVLTLVAVRATGGFRSEHVYLVRGLIECLLFWPFAVLLIKRGHDRDHSAAFTLGLILALAVGLALMVLVVVSPASGFGLAVFLAPLGVLGYLIVDYGFTDGTLGFNRYGPSPKSLGTLADPGVSGSVV